MTTPESRFRPAALGDSPRFAGVATFMRLPQVSDPARLDIAILGVPFDGGTTNRPGARHGPREMRVASSFLRPVHPQTRRSHYDLCRVADAGDCPINPVDLMDSLGRIERHLATFVAAGCVPLLAGGDNLVLLPALRAVAKARPVGMVHFDAHSDTWDSYFGGSRYTHGTPFRRAVEEGLLDAKRTVQIGLRGSLNAADDLEWAAAAGMRLITIEQLRAAGIEATLAAARAVVGAGPTYVCFDIDAIDPAFAPGTGTPEIGGLTTFEAQALVRGLGGLDLIGAEVVEVSPPFDVGGITALAGATLLFELLCVLAEAKARRG
ncbi:MAG: agmatinase [Alphaproteobacteria bacterium]|nr:agmatinase [Alphaproteobacteria bacterium]